MSCSCPDAVWFFVDARVFSSLGRLQRSTGLIRPLKHPDFQEDTGRNNRVIWPGAVDYPGIQQEPRTYHSFRETHA